jgi:hypothetical protein
MLAFCTSFSLPHPALLGLLSSFGLGWELWNSRERAGQWAVHEVPPEMSGMSPGRAEEFGGSIWKGSGVGQMPW